MFILNLKWAEVFYWILKQLGFWAWNELKYFGLRFYGKFLKQFSLYVVPTKIDLSLSPCASIISRNAKKITHMSV